MGGVPFCLFIVSYFVFAIFVTGFVFYCLWLLWCYTLSFLIMAHKNDYSVVVFFPAGNAKKWTYVHNIRSFANFLDKSHSSWSYLNVYDRREGKYLRRYYPTDQIPFFL